MIRRGRIDAHVGLDEDFFDFFKGFFVEFGTPPNDSADFLYHALAGLGQSLSKFVDQFAEHANSFKACEQALRKRKIHKTGFFAKKRRDAF